MRTFAEDYARGLASESAKKSAIESITGCEMFKAPNTFAPLDFSNDGKTIYAELKTRFIKHDQYDTALISASKIDHCNDPTKEYYFVWAYNDGLFYLKYNKEEWSKFECKDFCRNNTRADYNDRPQRTYYIPYQSLTRATTTTRSTASNV